MAQVSIRSTDVPTAPGAVPQAALSIIDSRGRTLTLRELGVLEQMRLLRRLGAENSPYFSFCMRLARVASIDGDPVRIPDTDLQFEALAQRLGEAGVTALVVHEMGVGADDEDGAPDPLKAAEAAKAQDASERATVKN